MELTEVFFDTNFLRRKNTDYIRKKRIKNNHFIVI